MLILEDGEAVSDSRAVSAAHTTDKHNIILKIITIALTYILLYAAVARRFTEMNEFLIFLVTFDSNQYVCHCNIVIFHLICTQKINY